MNTKLEVLYAEQTTNGDGETVSKGPTPVVRYADACAAIEKLEDLLDATEQLRANAVRRCGEWEKEVEKLVARIRSDIGTTWEVQDAETLVKRNISTGRWTGPLKAL